MLTLNWTSDAVPFSFVYDGAPSADLLPGWVSEAAGESPSEADLQHITFRDPGTGLSVTAHVRSYPDYPATEWVLEFENLGSEETPLLEQILPLDTSSSLDAQAKATLHYARGSACDLDDYLPQSHSLLHPKDHRLRPKGIRLTPHGGRSSNGLLPFMNLQCPGGGYVLAIGWTGQWAAEWTRGEADLRVQAGMERTCLRLHPGEKIRTPRILVILYQGDDPLAGNNLLRRVILDHYTPRIGGEIVLPPITHMTQSTYYRTGEMGEESQLRTIPQAAALGVEVFWMDACWYGQQREHADWWSNVGDWSIRQDAFPRGLKPIAEATHAAGMEYIVWWEPERVYRGTTIAREHPEFLLHAPHDSNNALFDLGQPEACRYMTETIANVIETSGIDHYRQDFNFEPLPYWQANDAPDRIGMHEIRHIEGLYAMWDALLARFPGLWIDNCASGGRRIDLETTMRSFPLWRSDYSDVGGPLQGPWLSIGDQIQTAGLARWVPLHAGAVWTFDPYAFRSALSTGITPYDNIEAPGYPADTVRLALAELKSLRPYYLGDFYPLLPLTASASDWCAYQFDRPDLQAGFAIFLRRHESPFSTMEAGLRGLDPDAAYAVTLSDSFVEPEPERLRGVDLMQRAIVLPERSSSLLLRYRRLA
ncbi:MAG: glycoside hydrolase family 36 protein [Anaerolineae bacterium]